MFNLFLYLLDLHQNKCTSSILTGGFQTCTNMSSIMVQIKSHRSTFFFLNHRHTGAFVIVTRVGRNILMPSCQGKFHILILSRGINKCMFQECSFIVTRSSTIDEHWKITCFLINIPRYRIYSIGFCTSSCYLVLLNNH